MERLIGAAVVFAGTNVDDLVVLTMLFLAGRTARWRVWAGQYAGIAVLVGVSALGALGLTVVPDRWVRLLGVFPLLLGLRGLVRGLRSSSEESPPSVASGMLSAAGVTIANGADNLAVYTPLFRTLEPGGVVVTVVVFAVGVAVWCLAASWLGSHRTVVRVIERWGHWIVPIVFIALGVLILTGAAL